ncbi:hypothetical protein B0J11DRAFT_426060 [Dendryphion nanum]|uniref:Heterokaryon incompatibility domain-containing protein n=1 Tax=Dendryphion nanum TaxID=256645 RepID=A0A9P9E9D7_9PLEO|nr:hypothetical protein B0J11DRAFT_426060 [Dendryphion nanum]
MFQQIDSLCIIRNHNDDWTREAGSMADVYANALLTTAADWGQDSDCGLFYSEEFKATPAANIEDENRWMHRIFSCYHPEELKVN